MQTLQENTQVNFVFLEMSEETKNVVQVEVAEGQSPKNLVHKTHEGLGGIHQYKAQPCLLVQFPGCVEGSLGNVSFCNGNLMKCLENVELREEMFTMQGVGKIVQVWDGIADEFRGGIETSVIPYEARTVESCFGMT